MISQPVQEQSPVIDRSNNIKQRLNRVTSKIEELTKKSRVYVPSTHLSCIEACQNMIKLNWQLKNFEKRSLNSDNEDLLVSSYRWIRDLAQSDSLKEEIFNITNESKDRIVYEIASLEYGKCVSSCIKDENHHRYPQDYTDCLIRATSNEQIRECQRNNRHTCQLTKLDKKLGDLEKMLDNFKK